MSFIVFDILKGLKWKISSISEKKGSLNTRLLKGERLWKRFLSMLRGDERLISFVLSPPDEVLRSRVGFDLVRVPRAPNPCVDPRVCVEVVPVVLPLDEIVLLAVPFVLTIIIYHFYGLLEYNFVRFCNLLYIYIKSFSGTNLSIEKKLLFNFSPSRNFKGYSTICPIILFLKPKYLLLSTFGSISNSLGICFISLNVRNVSSGTHLKISL
jgi:hypothetical protein